MEVYIRTDSSTRIGSGHVKRCLVLADELRRRGCNVNFICRDFEGSLNHEIVGKGYALHVVPGPTREHLDGNSEATHAHWLGAPWHADAEMVMKIIDGRNVDWLVVDHYAIDFRWHTFLRPSVEKIFVIDDLADRRLDCDLLLDQNFFLNPQGRYKGIIPENCISLLGPRYLLLKKEFLQVHRSMPQAYGSIKNILVFMGGADFSDETSKAIFAIDSLKYTFARVDVIVGGLNLNADRIDYLCRQRDKFYFHKNISNIEHYCSEADLAIGTGGVAALERCFIGLPSAVITVAQNQFETNTALAHIGAIKLIGWNNEIGVEDICRALEELLSDEFAVRLLAKKAQDIFKGGSFLGTAGVVDQMLRT